MIFLENKLNAAIGMFLSLTLGKGMLSNTVTILYLRASVFSSVSSNENNVRFKCYDNFFVWKACFRVR